MRCISDRRKKGGKVTKKGGYDPEKENEFEQWLSWNIIDHDLEIDKIHMGLYHRYWLWFTSPDVTKYHTWISHWPYLVKLNLPILLIWTFDDFVDWCQVLLGQLELPFSYIQQLPPSIIVSLLNNGQAYVKHVPDFVIDENLLLHQSLINRYLLL